MDDNKIKELWQAANEKLEQSILVNKNNTKDMTNMKV